MSEGLGGSAAQARQIYELLIRDHWVRGQLPNGGASPEAQAREAAAAGAQVLVETPPGRAGPST